MANTTNFGWETPDDTDLVKDGAAAMRTLGNSIDSSFVDLKGGTTGQILSKNSNTDLDYIWINNDQGDITAVTAGTGLTGGGTSGAVTLTNDMATTITAAGDIVVGTGSGTYDNLPIGTTGQILTADTTVSPYKVKWATAASGGSYTQLATGSLSGASTSITDIDGTYRDLVLVVYEWYGSNTDTMTIQFNSQTTGYMTKLDTWTDSTVNASTAAGTYALAGTGANSDNNQSIYMRFYEYANTSMQKAYYGILKHYRDASVQQVNQSAGYHSTQSAITTIQIKIASGTWSAGTYYLYGVK